jgi:hypothetical protein
VKSEAGMTMNTPERIVEVSAEGGSITLFGLRGSIGAWHFTRGVNDHTPTLLSDEEGGESPINHTTNWVSSWPELLDRYPWEMLRGTAVHPDFREQVGAEVLRRLQDKSGARSDSARERWAGVCGIKT